MKYVQEMSAWSRARAAIIDDPKGREVGRVMVAYPSDGAGKLVLDLFDWDNPDPDKRRQRGSASGYGYDKLAAALRGLTVDGVLLFGHCGTDDLTRKMLAKVSKLKGWDVVHGFAAKIQKAHGMTCANWDTERETYTSVYYLAGLDRLSAMGYRVRWIG